MNFVPNPEPRDAPATILVNDPSAFDAAFRNFQRDTIPAEHVSMIFGLMAFAYGAILMRKKSVEIDEQLQRTRSPTSFAEHREIIRLNETDGQRLRTDVICFWALVSLGHFFLKLVVW